MATQSFFVLSASDELQGGVIKGKDKSILGVARQEYAPGGEPYIVAKLEGHWIITTEELKEYKQLKKNESNNNGN